MGLGLKLGLGLEALPPRLVSDEAEGHLLAPDLLERNLG